MQNYDQIIENLESDLANANEQEETYYEIDHELYLATKARDIQRKALATTPVVEEIMATLIDAGLGGAADKLSSVKQALSEIAEQV